MASARKALFTSLISVVLLVTLPTTCLSSETNRPPNVLFIAVDDLRCELGCYGQENIQTPRIDELASSGVTFNRAYCQLAVCNPSRVSLMTGLRPDSTKVWDLRTRFRQTIPDVVTLPQQFKKHGYYAASFGKIFHNPWPDNASWSEPHQWPKKSKLWSRTALKRRAEFKKELQASGKPKAAVDRIRAQATEAVDVADHEHIDGAIAQQAISAMQRLAKRDEPFFLAVGFVRPHLPFVVPQKYWDLYKPGSIPLATNPFLPKNAPPFATNTMYELRDYLDFYGTPTPKEGSLPESEQRRLKHGYYASISLIDAQVGLLLDNLETLGLKENTVVVLWSDHGWKLGEHNSWCKQTNYEIDTRVPLIIRSPNAKANGQSTNALVELIDLYPTLCDLAGIPRAAHLQGKSMTPLLSDPKQAWEKPAFSQFRRRIRPARIGSKLIQLMGYAMRTDRYRYIEWQNRETQDVVARELYDHVNDPQENTNIAETPEAKDQIAELSRQMWNTLPTPPKLIRTAKRRTTSN